MKENNEEIKICYVCTKKIKEHEEYNTLCEDPKTGEQKYRHKKCKDRTPLKPMKKKKYKYFKMD